MHDLPGRRHDLLGNAAGTSRKTRHRRVHNYAQLCFTFAPRRPMVAVVRPTSGVCMKPSFFPPALNESRPANLVWAGEQMIPPWPAPADITGGFVDHEGERFYRISQFDAMAPFLITVVSASDHWLFVSSTGGLTAGRVAAERALFPYHSVDRLHDNAASTGPCTLMLVTRGDRTHLWEPFRPAGRLLYRLTRNLYKNTSGSRLCFEEINHDLGLEFRAEWTTSERFGFVRQVRLANDGFDPVSVSVIDGLRNLLPPGIPRRLLDEMSCLTDAYKRSEIIPETNLAVFALNSGITDQPVALESLLATVAWCEGLPQAQVLLTERQFDAFRQGQSPRAESDARGVRGVFAVSAQFSLGAGERQEWLIVADEGLTQSAVTQLAATLRAGGAGELVRADASAGTHRLRALVGGADGLQCSGDEDGCAHHFANVLFNLMRGGAFRRGYEISRVDFARFLAERNRAVAQRHADWLGGWPEYIDRGELACAVRERDDAELERLFLEYLPLGFSRRHGDPSRPWNRFAIHVRDENGVEVLEYEGNWRDIFQNWEALGEAHPGYLEHMVAKFVNASTLDGYNPYRITRRGVEWEVPAPEDPWAGIGYWGDHQVVYLLKLLEATERFVPGRLHDWLERTVFSAADVPYRIANYESLRRDPRHSIAFLPEHDRGIREREKEFGTDARLVTGRDGRVLRVTLAEKLLLTALVRLANLIPGGGIWMNTQRPEWNDGNNALVGFGVSGVTLFHLRRYLVFCRRLWVGLAGRRVSVSSPVADFAAEILAAFRDTSGREATIVADPRARRLVVDQLAAAGSRFRRHVYAPLSGECVALPGDELVGIADAALPLVEASLRALRRTDGLFHSYRLLHFDHDGTLPLDDLPLMLEGQVAALDSGLLTAGEAVELLRVLRASPLYCAARRSYLLQPDEHPPGFLERNIIPATALRRAPLLEELLAAGDGRLVVREGRGRVRFHASLVSAAALQERLAALADDPRWTASVRRDAAMIRGVYEEVFDHRAFTGRSGAMFAYEGLGSVYWHMVSKLLLAVQECHASAPPGAPAAAALAAAYSEIRDGLGFRQSPSAWGAFPPDPHSHSPAHAGAQQPGMTGQVKEGILARWGELGVRVEGGTVRFAPGLLSRREFTSAPRSFEWFDAAGEPHAATMPAGTIAFTRWGVPVIYRLVESGDVAVTLQFQAARSMETFVPAIIPGSLAAGLFTRAGDVARIDVAVPIASLLG